MSYTITFWDKSTKVIDNEKAERLKEVIRSGAETLDIGENFYKVSAIAQITKGGIDITDNKLIESKESDNREPLGYGYEKFKAMREKILNK